MERIIKLNGTAYPLARTTQGAKLLQRLNVDFKRVRNGHRQELQRYAYCIAAGAARASENEFDFTIETFIKAADSNWFNTVNAFINDLTNNTHFETKKAAKKETQAAVENVASKKKAKKPKI